MRIFLSGPMGSGKSTVAKAVAAKLGVEAIDLDEQIEQAEGKSVAAIFAERGELVFRELERRTLRSAIARHGNAVFAHFAKRPLFSFQLLNVTRLLANMVQGNVSAFM